MPKIQAVKVVSLAMNHPVACELATHGAAKVIVIIIVSAPSGVLCLSDFRLARWSWELQFNK